MQPTAGGGSAARWAFEDHRKSLASGNPIPLACMMLVLGPCYLYWPQSAGPALFFFMPVLLLMLAVKSYDRVASMPDRTQRPTSAPGGAGGWAPKTLFGPAP